MSDPLCRHSQDSRHREVLKEPNESFTRFCSTAFGPSVPLRGFVLLSYFLRTSKHSPPSIVAALARAKVFLGRPSSTSIYDWVEFRDYSVRDGITPKSPHRTGRAP